MKKIHTRLLLCVGCYLFGYLWMAQPVRLALADPGDLDATFGVDHDGDGTLDGYYLSDTGKNAYDFALNSNGSVYVVGGVLGCSATTQAPFGMLSSFTAAGAVDTAFGNDYDDPADGILDGYVKSSDDQVIFKAVAKDTSENLIVAGTSQGTTKDVFVNKFSATGTEDGFSTPATYDSGFDEEAYDVVVDSSNSMIAAGHSTNATTGNETLALFKFLSSGEKDTSFNADGPTPGVLSLSVSTLYEKFYSVALDVSDDGSAYDLVAAGYSLTSTANADLVLVKTDQNGELDAEFAEAGYLVKDFMGFSDVAQAVAVDSAHNIYVTGYRTDADGDEDVFVAKFDSKGALIDTFGEGGVAILDSGNGNEEAYALVLDSQGSILVGGNMVSSDGGAFFVARFTSAGALDTDFGDLDSSGTAKTGYKILTVASSSLMQVFYNLKLDSSENILAIGSSIFDGTTVGEQVVLAKFEGGYLSVECGDGNLSYREQCDDGNSEDYDGCSSACLTETDADGDGYYSDEDCDDADNTIHSNCSTGDDDDDDEATCGDGVKDSTEACDDGNLTAGDGCTAACLTETDADGDGYYGINDCDDTDKDVHVNCPDLDESLTEGSGGCGCVITSGHHSASLDSLMYGLGLMGMLGYRVLRQKARARD